MERPSVTVIGTGALGSALVRGLHQSGYPIKSLYNRHLRKAEKLSREVGAKQTREFPQDVAELGSLVFITVQDDEIDSVADQLSQLSPDFGGYLFVHCSGNESATALHALKKKGADAAAFHPLQTFTEHSGPEDFRNIYFDVEAESPVFSQLDYIAHTLGAHTIEITADSKPYLHAAAVLASNYLVALLDASARISELGGMEADEAMEAMLPLVYKTLGNIEQQGGSSALSGPIKRGDVQTVREHLKLLEDEPDLQQLYKKLGWHALKMVSGSGSTVSSKYQQLHNLLQDDRCGRQ